MDGWWSADVFIEISADYLQLSAFRQKSTEDWPTHPPTIDRCIDKAFNKNDMIPIFKVFIREVLTPYWLPTPFPKFNSLITLISSQLQPGTFICMLKPVYTCLIPNIAVFTDLGGGFEFFQLLLCLPSCLFFNHAVFDHNFLIFRILWVKILSVHYFDQFSAIRFLSPTQELNRETSMD